MEKVCGFIPMNPHAAEIIAQQIVEGIPREEAQAVRDPVCLVRRVVIVSLSALAKVTNRLSTLLIGPRPDTKGDTVEGMRGVLLKDKCVVNAVRLALACANLDVMREACLRVGRD